MENIIQLVPVEIWPQIFSYLESVPFTRCQSVCKTWKALYNDKLWHDCFAHHFKMTEGFGMSLSIDHLVPKCFASWQDCVKNLFGSCSSKLNIVPNQKDAFKAVPNLTVIPLIRNEDMQYSAYLSGINTILYHDNFGPMFGLPEPTSFTAKDQISKYSLSFLNWEPGATPIYYIYADGQWKWSPDNSAWMSVKTSTVEEGMWAGHKPVPGNVKLIETLRAVSPVLIVQSIDANMPSFAIIDSVVVPKLDNLVLTEEFIGANNVKMVRVWRNINLNPHAKMTWLFKPTK
eukprot:TRINITY_DN8684_c0_g1_i1.p1 TRINITY_DN8684_c0_g1~~TRINITY_DN8684_c0_g1_i1.p1  ORF type:complete len:288 (-),score=-1.42 TRINITY_DN8684_c0_g1_i1:31-894(-)